MSNDLQPSSISWSACDGDKLITVDEAKSGQSDHVCNIINIIKSGLFFIGRRNLLEGENTSKQNK